MVSCLVLRGGLAVAVAVLASSLSGTIAVAQQIAVNVEGQAAQEASPGRGATGRRRSRGSCLSIRARRPERSSSIRVNAISQPNDWAIRYGIGVGRTGFQRSGVERVSQKQEWPDWCAPPEMVGWQPYLPRFMAGGPQAIPSGREPSISVTPSSASMEPTSRRRSGTPFRRDAFRPDNADVIDLYDRVQVGAKVLVRQSAHVSCEMLRMFVTG